MMKYGKTSIAIVANTPVFALLHIFNPGMTVLAVINPVLCGPVFSPAMWATDSIWIVFGIHAMWNFNQSILPGLPNSGGTVAYSVFRVVGDTCDSYAYSTTFGLEGALVCTAVYIIVAFAFYLIGRKRAA